MQLRKLGAMTLASATLIGASVIGLAGSASALDCASGHVCGAAANGNSFDYYKCGVTYTLPNLLGSGPLVNNETGNVTASFYDSNHNLLFTSRPGDNRTVDWTPVQYATAC